MVEEKFEGWNKDFQEDMAELQRRLEVGLLVEEGYSLKRATEYIDKYGNRFRAPSLFGI